MCLPGLPVTERAWGALGPWAAAALAGSAARQSTKHQGAAKINIILKVQYSRV